MTPGDELDVTQADKLKTPEEQAQEKAEDVAMAESAGGMGLLSKLLFFCVIGGIVIVVLRMRKGSQGSPGEKSLA